VHKALRQKLKLLGRDLDRKRVQMVENYMMACHERFFGITYWKRMWIIQELALSQNVCFRLGQQSIDLLILQKAIKFIRRRISKRYNEAGYRNVLYLLKIWYK
jgi:hypothetical protein